MGNEVSSTNVLTVDVSNSIDIMYNTLVTNKMETVSNKINSNTVTIRIGPGGVVNGNLNLSQTINTASETTGRLDSTVLQSLSSKIQSDLGLAADQSAKATAGWLSSSDVDTTNVSQIKQALSQSISENFTASNYNSIVDNTVNVNTGFIEILGVWNGDVNITQGIVAKIVTQNTITNIINRTNQILQDQKADLRISQDADSKAKGETITGTARISSGISSCIICIIIISLLLIALSPAGQRGLNKASNAGAARYSSGKI